MKTTLPLLAIIVCVISIWCIYGNFQKEENIVTATKVSYEDTIEEQAVIIRKEYPVKVSSAGFFQNSVQDGSRVYKGQTLGGYYTGSYDKDIANKLTLINTKLREETLSQTVGEAMINDTITIDNRITECTLQISALAADGNQGEINKIRNRIDELLERKNKIETGMNTGNENTVEALTAQKNELEAKLGSSKQDLFAPEAGIIIINADGYEETLSADKLNAVSQQQLEEIINKNASETEETVYPYPVCKIVDNSKWILAIVCDENKISPLRDRKYVDVRLKNEGAQIEECRIEEIRSGENGKALLFVSGTHEMYNLMNSRTTSVEVLIEKYEGLKVPSEAVKNGKSGAAVYVRTSEGIVPKNVEVLYENDEMCIIKEDNNAEGGLRLYDEVVIE